jgi:hypothetical protein
LSDAIRQAADNGFVSPAENVAGSPAYQPAVYDDSEMIRKIETLSVRIQSIEQQSGDVIGRMNQKLQLLERSLETLEMAIRGVRKPI